MLKGIELSQRINFTFSDDTDPKTIVTLRPLSGVEMAELSNFQENGTVKLSTDYIVRMLQKTIVKIENYPHEGSILEADSAKDEIFKFINGLNIKHLGEITNEITSINNVTRQEAKN